MLVRIDDRHLGSEPTHRLRQFDAHIASTDDEKVFGNFFEFERLDVSEGLGLSKAGDLWEASREFQC